MKRFDCQLCGGKLRNGKCELCGWVNQSDSDYLLNKSSCDAKPLTHVHKENVFDSHKTSTVSKTGTGSGNRSRQGAQAQPTRQYRAKMANQKSTPYRSRDVKKKGKGLSVLAVLIAVLSLAPSLLKVTQETVSNYMGSSASQQAEDDLYSFATRELSDTGEKWSMDIRPGIYKVGVDIPEGLYDLEAVSGRGSFNLSDRENYIYYYQYLTDDPQDKDEFSGMNDIRLYKGADIQIFDGLTLKFTTETGQTDQLVSEPNPLTEEVLLPQGTEEYAGQGFAAGVYDLTVRDAWTYFKYEIPLEGKPEEFEYNSLFLDDSYAEDGVYTFKNVELPEGTRVYAEDADVEMVPSRRICPEE